MPVLTTISGIPLFSTPQEALSWATANGLSGYHTHMFNGQVGYMGGSSHSHATQRSNVSTPQQPQTTSPPQGGSSGGNGGGGGGGGGY